MATVTGTAGDDTLALFGDGTILGGDGNDVLTTEVLMRASTAADGTEANSSSFNPRLSSDGRVLVFMSDASNLVAGDSNGRRDIFVRDLDAGTVTRVSTATNGTQSNAGNEDPAIAADGRYVAFTGYGSNLVAGDTNSRDDVFIHDLQTGTVTRVSTAANGTQGNGDSYGPVLSADGLTVAFTSTASNLVADDTNSRNDVFVRDLQSGTVTWVSTATDGTQGNGSSYVTAMSGDGRYVAFQSYASNLVAGDTNGDLDVFVRDLQTNTVTRVSTAADGTEGNSYSQEATLSQDGRLVAFVSDASNLVDGDTNGTTDVFVRDLQTGTVTRVSTATDGTEGASYNSSPVFSPDGRYLAFSSNASNLVAGDSNGSVDIFVRDLQTGTVTRISTAADGTEGSSGSYDPSFSTDGRTIAFESFANDLVAGDTGNRDIFLRSLSATQTLTGGAGDDTYVVLFDTIMVQEAAGEGTDTVQTALSYTLTANVENLTLTGSGAVDGTGNALANVLTGTGAANTLDGGAGADSLVGGAGDDVYVVDNAGDTITEAASAGTDTVRSSVSYSLAANVETLTLTGASAISGTGNALANSLTGNAAANTLDGGAGADTLAGGAGNDVYVIDSAGDRVSEAAGAGSDRVLAAISYRLGSHLEILTLTGGRGLRGTGNGLANVLTGNRGNNRLDGRGGADRMAGGAGNDTYVVDHARDRVTERRAGGRDTVISSVSHVLRANVEALRLTGRSAINGTGTGGVNTLTGNRGANRLDGRGGADTLSGGGGADALTGGGGGDTLRGGRGGDVFRYTTPGEGGDRITDFAGNDRLTFAARGFGGLARGGLDAAAFESLAASATATATGTRFLFNRAERALYYDADGSGARAAVRIATLGGRAAVTAGDIFIV